MKTISKLQSPNKFFMIIINTFFIISILFLIIGGMLIIEFHNFRENAVETEATITEISHRGAKGIDVEYEIDGRVYDKFLSQYSSSMRVGDHVRLFCAKDDPENVRTMLRMLPAGIFLLIGIIFMIVSLVIKATMHSSEREVERFIDRAEEKRAEFVKVDRKYNIEINGVCPYYIICKVEHGGKKWFVKSGYFFDDGIAELIKDDNISELPIYISSDDKRYVLDLRELGISGENKIKKFRRTRRKTLRED